MKPKEKIKQLLVKHPIFRERKYKDNLTAQLLQKRYPKLSEMKAETVEELIREVLLHDRYWRQVTKDNPYLRGSDYGQKKKKMEYAVREIYKN